MLCCVDVKHGALNNDGKSKAKQASNKRLDKLKQKRYHFSFSSNRIEISLFFFLPEFSKKSRTSKRMSVSCELRLSGFFGKYEPRNKITSAAESPLTSHSLICKNLISFLLFCLKRLLLLYFIQYIEDLWLNLKQKQQF